MFRRRTVDVSPGHALRRLLPVVAALLACAAPPVSSPARAAEEVGVAASVRPSAVGTPPASQTRVLEVGNRLVFEERIETNRFGNTQVLFLDGTTLSIGRSSRVTLDAFVYDPDERTGDLALSILEGVVRFIGGRISKLNPVKIRTPRAEIGIRGGIAIIEATALESSVSFLFGEELTVTPLDARGAVSGETFRLRTPGFQVRVRDGAVSDPAPVVSGTVTDTIAVDASEEAPAGEDGDGDARAASIERLAEERMGPEGAERSPEALAPAVADLPASDAPAAPEKVELESLQREGAEEQLAAGPSQELAAKRYDGNFRRVVGASAANGFAPLDAERLAAGDPGFSGARREEGRLLVTLTDGGEEVYFDFPAAAWNQGGELAFADVEQPDGSRISGTGYWDPLGQYFWYEGTRTFVDGEGREVTETGFLFGGERFRDEEIEPGSGSRLAAYEVRPDPALRARLPFLRVEDGGNIANARVSPFYALTQARDDDGTLVDEASARTGGIAALAIEGRGEDQRSALTMATLATYRSADGVLRRSGGMRGTSRTAAHSGPRRLGASVGTVPTGAGAYDGGAHLLGAVDGDPSRGALFFVLDNNIPDSPQSTGPAASGEFDLATGFERWETYTFTHPATRIDTPSGVGSQRSTRSLNGYAAGLYEPATVLPDPGQSSFVDPVSVANRNDRPEDVKFDFRAERNRLRATFHLRSTGRYDAPNRENDFKPGTEFTNVDIVVGTLHSDESPHRSVFVDDDRFMARDARHVGEYRSRVHSLVDGQTPAHERTYLVSSALVPLDTFLPPGVAWCECRYTEWGWWGGALTNAANTARYRSHLATFVAGMLPDSSDLPASGSASYSGHLVGPVTNGDEMYIAAGAFEKTWNFATRRGDVTVSDFDGADYAGTLTSAAGRDFEGSITSTTASFAGRGGDLAGSFFRAGSDPVGEVGGRFRIEDRANGYGATGIFQAAKAGP